MRRRFLKVAALSLLSLLAVVAIAGGFVYWRLTQGPVSLAFMNDRIETEMNKRLGGLAVNLSDVIVELDPKTRAPGLRLRNIELRDAGGNVIARAPRAAIGIDRDELLSARLTPRSLELIGPRILVKRGLDGGFSLGFGVDDGADTSPIIIDDAGVDEPGKADQSAGASAPAAPLAAPEAITSGAAILDILAGRGGEQAGLLGGVESIRVSDASISLYDESNDAVWSAPNAEVAFKKMPYGFAVVGQTSVTSAAEPWRMEVAASFRRETRTFQVNARLFDFVPANVADKIFALSRLAQMRLPLSGEADLVVTDKGLITDAKAELALAPGRVNFPEYIADAIDVESGAASVAYDPATGGLIITKATILAEGATTELTGRIDPARGSSGKLTALHIVVNAKKTASGGEDGMIIDRIDFDGVAATEEARLDVADLIVRSGESGVRLRGSFSGGEESTAIRLGGRIKNMPAAVLKKLWPPVVAPRTRKWVADNIKSGTVTDAELRIDIPANALARAKEKRVLPDEMIDITFDLAGVTTSYFKDLPKISGASGSGHVRGNRFDLTWRDGEIALPSGKTIAVRKGAMAMTDLLAVETPGKFDIQAAGSAAAALEYIDQPALNMLSRSGLDAARLGGDAVIDIDLAMPLMKDIPRDKVLFSASAKVANASLKGAVGGIELSGGDIDLEIGKGGMSGSGPIKINGIPARISWTRKAGENAVNAATIETTLDEGEREKIGARVNDYVKGPVAVKVTIPEFKADVRKAFVEADLSKATLRLDAINFVRPPVKSAASFTFESGEGKPTRITDLDLAGGGVAIKGDIVTAPKGGIVEARLSSVVLNDENRFAITIKRGESGMSVAINGRSFDARPLIKSMFANKSSGGAGGGPSYFVDLNVDRVYAHRGEVVTGVTGSMVVKGSAVRRTDINGVFLSGQPIRFRIAGNEDGSRQLQVVGRDAGSALRASNLYSKVAGGQIEFNATLSASPNGGIQDGLLVIRNFEVRNEAALAQLDKKGKPRKSGPRRDGLAFKKFTLPFTSDAKFIRINDAAIKGTDICAYAEGVIRKADTAIDITGSVIPACAANRLLEDVPVVGLFFPEGLLGITYALSGTMAKPKFQANPLSALAPGIFRKLFSYESPSKKRKSSDLSNSR